jgi:hypothetical protein
MDFLTDELTRMVLDPGPMEEGHPWLGDSEIVFDPEFMGWFPRWHPILFDDFNQRGVAPDQAPLPGTCVSTIF